MNEEAVFVASVKCKGGDAEYIYDLLQEQDVASEIPALKYGSLEAFREVLARQIRQEENVGIGFIQTIRVALDENIEIYEDYNSVFAGFICYKQRSVWK